MIPKVKFCVKYGFYQDFINGIIGENIPLYSVHLTDFGFSAECYAADYKKIARLASRYQCRTRITERHGIYFLLRKYRNRKGIIAGVTIYFALCFLFSLLIWKIEIKTDDANLKNTLAHSLFNYGVYRGNICSKSKLEDVQRQLMLENEKLGYITLNFYKGILTCEVYDRQEKTDEKKDYSDTDIFCRLNGVITDIRVYRGFAKVAVGQSVSRGDVMVSAAETDVKGRFFQSQTAAYIAGDCYKEYTVFVPFDKMVSFYTGHTAKDVTLNVLGMDFRLMKADISSYELYTKQQIISQLNLCGFLLPCTIKTVVYSSIKQQQIYNNLPSAMKAAQSQLKHLIIADIKLEKEYSRQYDYQIEEDGITAKCRVSGRYVMT